MTKKEKGHFIRIAALQHDALGITRVKVIFREGGRRVKETGNEAAYWMDGVTYDRKPKGEDVTLQEYIEDHKEGELPIVEANNLDIYSNQ